MLPRGCIITWVSAYLARGLHKKYHAQHWAPSHLYSKENSTSFPKVQSARFCCHHLIKRTSIAFILTSYDFLEMQSSNLSWSLSAFFIKVSQYTVKTTSIRLAYELDIRANLSRSSTYLSFWIYTSLLSHQWQLLMALRLAKYRLHPFVAQSLMRI